MALIRFTLDLAIPEDIYHRQPAIFKGNITRLIRGLKALSVVINEGQPNEERTTKATWHRCHHDTGEPCELEEEV